MSATLPSSPSTVPPRMTCPFCRSDQVSTTTKTTDTNTYWRCGGCGQIWNPSRLVAPRNGWPR